MQNPTADPRFLNQVPMVKLKGSETLERNCKTNDNNLNTSGFQRQHALSLSSRFNLGRSDVHRRSHIRQDPRVYGLYFLSCRDGKFPETC